MDISQDFSSIDDPAYDDHFYETSEWSTFTTKLGNNTKNINPNGYPGNWSSSITNFNTQVEINPVSGARIFFQFRYVLAIITIILILAFIEGIIFFPVFFQYPTSTPFKYTPELSLSLILALIQLYVIYKLLMAYMVKTHPQLKYTPKIILYKDLFDNQISGVFVWMSKKSQIISDTPMGKIRICRTYLPSRSIKHSFRPNSSVAVALIFDDQNQSSQDLTKKNFIILYRIREEGEDYLFYYIEDLLGILGNLEPTNRNSLVFNTTDVQNRMNILHNDNSAVKIVNSALRPSIKQKLGIQWVKHWYNRNSLVGDKPVGQEWVFELEPTINLFFVLIIALPILFCIDIIVLGYFYNDFNYLTLWDLSFVTTSNTSLIFYNSYSALNSNFTDRVIGLMPTLVFSFILLYYVIKVNKFALYLLIFQYFDLKSQKRLILNQSNHTATLEFSPYFGDKTREVFSFDSLICNLRQTLLQMNTEDRTHYRYQIIQLISLQIKGYEFFLKNPSRKVETKDFYHMIYDFIEY